MFSARNLFLGGSGFFVFMISTYGSYLYQTSKRTPSDTSPEISSDARHQVYESNASSHDDSIGFEELLPWYYRKMLIRKARGKVLEVGIGTGRNLTKYNTTVVHEITGIDSSLNMLKVALGKSTANDLLLHRTTLIQMDAQKLSFSDNSFDCVVDTFGLCSYSDPLIALREMKRVCKIGGKLLLLEHGKSVYPSFDWLNRLLDMSVRSHEKKWGCTWNRDILALIQGLEDVKMEEADCGMFGTIHSVVLVKIK